MGIKSLTNGLHLKLFQNLSPENPPCDIRPGQFSDKANCTWKRKRQGTSGALGQGCHYLGGPQHAEVCFAPASSKSLALRTMYIDLSRSLLLRINLTTERQREEALSLGRISHLYRGLVKCIRINCYPGMIHSP